jgi:hypothetical protein
MTEGLQARLDIDVTSREKLHGEFPTLRHHAVREASLSVAISTEFAVIHRRLSGGRRCEASATVEVSGSTEQKLRQLSYRRRQSLDGYREKSRSNPS